MCDRMSSSLAFVSYNNSSSSKKSQQHIFIIIISFFLLRWCHFWPMVTLQLRRRRKCHYFCMNLYFHLVHILSLFGSKFAHLFHAFLFVLQITKKQECLFTSKFLAMCECAECPLLLTRRLRLSSAFQVARKNSWLRTNIIFKLLLLCWWGRQWWFEPNKNQQFSAFNQFYWFPH